MPINWCPKCKIGLANEEVIAGKCERCGAETEKRKIKQWMLKITKYADRLIDDLEKVDYSGKIRTQQINWIGRSHGTEVDFKILNLDEKITVFTTRIDTLFGVTALVIAPEHPLVDELMTKEKKAEIKKYVEASKKKSEIERTEAEKEKTGVFTGVYCVNPANDEKVPIWVGDYVVAAYGGGAVMVVPGHDKRDYDFAKKYGLEIREVVSGGNIAKEAYVDDGILVNSERFTGLKSEEARQKITKWLEDKRLGRKTIQYKLRDWIFSRQHYWGEPIPVIHCEKCGAVPVSEKDLPVKLPYVKKYKPTKTGESPLASMKEWLNVKCPECGGPAKRETDTMPNWAGSSWYFLRYTDPKNKKEFSDFKKLKYWMPVDLYNGGMEHTTLHLLYSRFWHKFLYDLKLVPTPEPYAARRSHGMVLAEDGRKMSKSFGNVINPDEIVKKFGADTLRMYEMFMGPFDQAINWSNQGVVGVFRFLNRVWNLQSRIENRKQKIENRNSKNKKIETLLHKSIKKISEDLENMKFNTAVSQLMILVNEMEKESAINREIYKTFLKILAPFAPHLAEELWHLIGGKKSIHLENWPKYDPEKIKEKNFELVIQINGKVRAAVSAPMDITEEEARELALSQERVKTFLGDKTPRKIIFIPQRLINIVVW
jgi:leucyl-tRNA synthetase